jgi:hypothetical protein
MIRTKSTSELNKKTRTINAKQTSGISLKTWWPLYHISNVHHVVQERWDRCLSRKWYQGRGGEESVLASQSCQVICNLIHYSACCVAIISSDERDICVHRKQSRELVFFLSFFQNNKYTSFPGFHYLHIIELNLRPRPNKSEGMSIKRFHGHFSPRTPFLGAPRFTVTLSLYEFLFSYIIFVWSWIYTRISGFLKLLVRRMLGSKARWIYSPSHAIKNAITGEHERSWVADRPKKQLRASLICLLSKAK